MGHRRGVKAGRTLDNAARIEEEGLGVKLVARQLFMFEAVEVRPTLVWKCKSRRRSAQKRESRTGTRAEVKLGIYVARVLG